VSYLIFNYTDSAEAASIQCCKLNKNKRKQKKRSRRKRGGGEARLFRRKLFPKSLIRREGIWAPTASWILQGK